MWPEAPRVCNAEGVFYRVLYLSLFRKTFSEGSSSISYMDSEGSRMSVHDNIYTIYISYQNSLTSFDSNSALI